MNRNTLRTLIIGALVLGLLATAFLMHRPHGGPLAITDSEETDWSKWLSIIAGVLTAIEVAIRTILQLLSRKKEAVDAAPKTPAPSG